MASNEGRKFCGRLEVQHAAIHERGGDFVISSLLAGYGFIETAQPESAEGPKAPGAPGALPCLNSDNSTKPEVTLTLSQRRTAYALEKNVSALADIYGVERLGFLTLTFADDVQEIREAQRRFNSLCTHAIRGRYREWICVVERQKSGRVHFHLLVVMPEDIRTGFDFEGVRRLDYRSASKLLRLEWEHWRDVAPKHGFGRCELLPIMSNAEAISKYLGKYISKHIGNRSEADKGARLVRYSKGTNRHGCHFSFVTAGTSLWRAKLKLLATACGFSDETWVAAPNRKAKEADEFRPHYFKTNFGPRWAYKLKTLINSIRLPVYPTAKQFFRDYQSSLVPLDATDVRVSGDDARTTLRAAVLGARSEHLNFRAANRLSERKWNAVQKWADWFMWAQRTIRTC